MPVFVTDFNQNRNVSTNLVEASSVRRSGNASSGTVRRGQAGGRADVHVGINGLCTSAVLACLKYSVAVTDGRTRVAVHVPTSLNTVHAVDASVCDFSCCLNLLLFV